MQDGRTLDCSDGQGEVATLFEDASATALDEVVEARCELRHAAAQVVEVEVESRERAECGGSVEVRER